MSEAEPLDRCRSILLARGYALREGTPEATAALAHLDLGAGGGYEALWVASRLIADVPLDVIAAEHLGPQEHGPPPHARQNLLIAMRVRTKDGPFDRRFEVTAASPDEVSRALPDRLRKAMVTARFAGVARIWPGLMLIFGAPPVDSVLVPTWMSSFEPLAEALHLAKGYR